MLRSTRGSCSRIRETTVMETAVTKVSPGRQYSISKYRPLLLLRDGAPFVINFSPRIYGTHVFTQHFPIISIEGTGRYNNVATRSIRIVRRSWLQTFPNAVEYVRVGLLGQVLFHNSYYVDT